MSSQPHSPQLVPQLILALPTADATRQLGAALSHLPAGTTLLLSGDLGSGKTTLAQGLGNALGITEPLVSPTFALLHEYHDGKQPLYHFDLYRLTAEQVSTLAPETYWDGSEAPLGIVLIEWCDRLPYPPDAALSITLEAIASGDTPETDSPDLGRIATLTLMGHTKGHTKLSLEAIAVAFEAQLSAALP